MDSPVRVYLFGSLGRKEKPEETSPILVDLTQPRTLQEVIELLHISNWEISLAMVNHKSVPRDWPVRPGDRLALFPREYPIFADWLDHRLNV